MSAAFKLAKRKYTQNDLRRMMGEHKMKVKQQYQQERIDSPLAKYNDLGQLTCILCKTVVRSESVWKVHINSKLHRENIVTAKQLKDQFAANKIALKRPAKEIYRKAISEKKPKESEGAETVNSRVGKTETENSMIRNREHHDDSESNYFKTTLGKTSIKVDLVNFRRNVNIEVDSVSTDIDTQNGDNKEDKLPEGFFDDPVKYAKIYNLEYKDPLDEQWDKFQREIKEESTVSNAIIAEEQDESTAKRQMEEIDEQIRKWSIVLDLEKRREYVISNKTKAISCIDAIDSDSNDDDNSDDNGEFLDWRSKRSDRKLY